MKLIPGLPPNWINWAVVTILWPIHGNWILKYQKDITVIPDYNVFLKHSECCSGVQFLNNWDRHLDLIGEESILTWLVKSLDRDYVKTETPHYDYSTGIQNLNFVITVAAEFLAHTDSCHTIGRHSTEQIVRSRYMFFTVLSGYQFFGITFMDWMDSCQHGSWD